ncbi:hypothetical protein ACA910_017321 [Epithemia clementina (nom. ined.)]
MPNPGETYGPYTKAEDGDMLQKSANNMPNPGDTYGPYTKDEDLQLKSANNMPNPGDTYGPYTKALKSANNMPNPGDTYGPYTKAQKSANNMPNPGDTYGPYTKAQKSANNMPNPGDTYGPYTKAQKSANNMPNPGDTYGPYTKAQKSANNMPNPSATYGPHIKDENGNSAMAPKLPNDVASQPELSGWEDSTQNEDEEPGIIEDYEGIDTNEEDLQKSANFIDFSIGGTGTGGGYNRPSGAWNGGSSTSRNGGGFSTWEVTQMKDYMAIADVTHDKLPLGIENGAPDFSAFIASNGNVGLGTSYPAANLHLVGDSPFIRLEDDTRTSSNNQNVREQTWDIAGTTKGFYVYEETRDSREMPFLIQAGAKSSSFVVAQNGQVGLGTDDPKARLHVFGSARIDGTLQVGNCRLDANTCQWKPAGRRLREDEMDELARKEEESLVDILLEQMDQQHERASATIRSLERRVVTLEDAMAKQEARFMGYIEVLKADIALVQHPNKST